MTDSLPAWVQRLQAISTATAERASTSTLSLQRLLAAVASPGVTPERLAAELPRFSSEYGPEAYRWALEVATRFLARSMRLASRYQEEYLRRLLPASQLAATEAPRVPAPPESSDASEWGAWYQLYVAWAAEQQAWSGRLYRMLLERVSAGTIRPEEVQQSAREFLSSRLPDYLADMAEINADLAADLIALGDHSIDALSRTLVGEPAPEADELRIAVRGAAGTTAHARLLVENSRPDPATVACEVRPRDGFGLATAPVECVLATGEKRPVTIHVALPDHPTGEPRLSGTVVIRGQGDADLVVSVWATVTEATRPGITVRALEPPSGPPVAEHRVAAEAGSPAAARAGPAAEAVPPSSGVTRHTPEATPAAVDRAPGEVPEGRATSAGRRSSGVKRRPREP